jgi:tetratricopeptide (TPR) repeat protein
MRAVHHVVLASYYMNMNRTDEAQRELYLASLGKMTSDFIKAFYLQILINVKIIQGCFDEAAKIYSDNRQTIQSYCDNHNDVYSAALYGIGAILCAKQGKFDEATALLDKTEPAIQRDKELVFNKNISLMIVYLIKGDVQTADKIKQDLLRDLQTFSGFELGSSKMIYTNKINNAQMRYDPREQMKESKE